MIYVISEAEKYFGFYDNITLMDQNIFFLKNNNIVKNVVIYKLNNLSFGTELVEKPSPIKTISKKIFVIYDKINNKFITYHESENYLKEMIKFFKTNYEVLEITLNSININFKIEVKEEAEKIAEPKKISEEDKLELFELNREINILKQQQKRLSEKKIEFESDCKLYKRFVEELKKDESFIIPELFKKKFEVISKLDQEGELTLEKFLSQDTTNFMENSYELLFEGGNSLNLSKPV